MNFEEIDGDYDSYGNLINKSAIMNATFSQEINDTFKYVNNIEFHENQSLWIIDIDSQQAVNHRENLKNIYFNMEKELNDSIDDTNFPSFYEFMRKRELQELQQKDKYLRSYNENKTSKNMERYDDFEPSSKDLKLLSSFSAIEWTRTWIYEMLHVPDYFPTFMFQDMFKMRDFGQKNNSKHYFYIGYYPTDINLKHGPYYVGAFELVPKMREFRTYVIIQNPYYCTETTYDETKIKDFKKELMAMCNDATVFFKFSNLQNTSEQRYYYSWLYEE